MTRAVPFKNLTQGLQKALKVNKTFATNEKDGIARDQDDKITIPVTKHYFLL